MKAELAQLISKLTNQMRRIKAAQEDSLGPDSLTDREIMVLIHIHANGEQRISDITAAVPDASESTMSMCITKLWREKKMVTKSIDPENQRVTLVGLTQKGRKTIEAIIKQREERFAKLFEAIEMTDEEERVYLNILRRATKYFDELLDSQ